MSSDFLNDTELLPSPGLLELLEEYSHSLDHEKLVSETSSSDGTSPLVTSAEDEAFIERVLTQEDEPIGPPPSVSPPPIPDQPTLKRTSIVYIEVEPPKRYRKQVVDLTTLNLDD